MEAPIYKKKNWGVRVFVGKEGIKRKKGDVIAKSRDKSDVRKDLIQGLCGTGEMSSFLHYPSLPAGSSQVGSPTWGLHGS